MEMCHENEIPPARCCCDKPRRRKVEVDHIDTLRPQSRSQGPDAPPGCPSSIDRTGHVQPGGKRGVACGRTGIREPNSCLEAGAILSLRQIDSQPLRSPERRSWDHMQDGSQVHPQPMNSSFSKDHEIWDVTQQLQPLASVSHRQTCTGKVFVVGIVKRKHSAMRQFLGPYLYVMIGVDEVVHCIDESECYLSSSSPSPCCLSRCHSQVNDVLACRRIILKIPAILLSAAIFGVTAVFLES